MDVTVTVFDGAVVLVIVAVLVVLYGRWQYWQGRMDEQEEMHEELSRMRFGNRRS